MSSWRARKTIAMVPTGPGVAMVALLRHFAASLLLGFEQASPDPRAGRAGLQREPRSAVPPEPADPAQPDR